MRMRKEESGDDRGKRVNRTGVGERGKIDTLFGLRRMTPVAKKIRRKRYEQHGTIKIQGKRRTYWCTERVLREPSLLVTQRFLRNIENAASQSLLVEVWVLRPMS